jgi:hypothetical protein
MDATSTILASPRPPQFMPHRANVTGKACRHDTTRPLFDRLGFKFEHLFAAASCQNPRNPNPYHLAALHVSAIVCPPFVDRHARGRAIKWGAWVP